MTSNSKKKGVIRDVIKNGAVTENSQLCTSNEWSFNEFHLLLCGKYTV